MLAEGRHASLGRFAPPVVLAGCILCLAPADLMAGHDAFCSGLEAALRSVGADHGLADITGLDAGIYRETRLTLPRAQICVSTPGGHPSPEWRCLVSSESKYLLALKAFGKTVSRVGTCLGSAWTSHDVDSDDFSRVSVLTNPGSAARVHVRMTKEVKPVGSWGKYRIVVAVSASPEAATLER